MINPEQKLNPKIFDNDIEQLPIRKGFGEGLLIAADKDKRVVGLCADLTESTQMHLLRNKYPELRVYSFDYSIDLSAVKAMLAIYKIKDTELPALVLDDKLLTGFYSLEDLELYIKESFKLQEKKLETRPLVKPAQ